MVVTLANANHLTCHLKRVRVFGVQACDESVSFSRFNHHHAEVVAFVHLILSLLRCVALAFHLLRKELCVAMTAFILSVVAKVENLNTLKVQLQFFSRLLNLYVVSQENGEANALLFARTAACNMVGCVPSANTTRLGLERAVS